MMPATLVSQSPLCLAIMAYRESLAVLCHGQLEEGSCCIWVMKEYGVAESWAKLYNITLPGVLYQTIGLRENGKVLLSMCENHKRLHWYDCETKTLTNAGYTGSADAFTADTFMESLKAKDKDEIATILKNASLSKDLRNKIKLSPCIMIVTVITTSALKSSTAIFYYVVKHGNSCVENLEEVRALHRLLAKRLGMSACMCRFGVVSRLLAERLVQEVRITRLEPHWKHKLSSKVLELEMLLDAGDAMLLLPFQSNGKEFVRNLMPCKEKGSDLVL
ncbi:hypothetical protein RHSIM_Rhsim04G0065400 [Rhododendron simsii]|uniref:F-box associated domain-containing protein n=1 Tax=Rhododendron simsii TaxID=118357 RepID=A0A834GZV6_RHOSS|nr:hypothetical protein RHSIM_Rhsim04G0065400 [Rhododendron simsii]